MPVLRLVQFRTDDNSLGVARVAEDLQTLVELVVKGGTYGLAGKAMAENNSLSDACAACKTGREFDFDSMLDEGRVLPPICHPDPTHCLVSGTGLTHLASAAGRDAMHSSAPGGETDSMKMYRHGLEGGRPAAGAVGAEPEWFYKGNGSTIAAPGAPLVLPHFAMDGGEEPELAGIYVIDASGRPRRLGFSIGNEFSDHVLEKSNYLSLAHSKLRMCSLGPELIAGELPASLAGEVRIRRAGDLLWSAEFRTGEEHMCHRIANLEHHHFKYRQFRHPGNVHVHFLGTSTASFADGVRTAPGDWFEVALPPFCRPLRNQLELAGDEGVIEAAPL